MTILDEVDAGTRDVLERFGFDAERFETLRARVAAGELSAAANVVTGRVEAPSEGDIARLPEEGSARFEEAAGTGREALRRGAVAQVVLAGGMATRFGGVVKGVVEALDGRSFLSWKLGETARLAAELDATIPVAVMTSFATDEETRHHVAALEVPEPLWFSQFVAPRLTLEGELYRDREGLTSLHGPGHGDLFEALRRSSVLAGLRAAGVRVIQVSNVDNLGARIDPVVVGEHLLAGRPVTAEVAAKRGDTGGAPARVDGRLVILEGPRFPPSFDQGAIPVFGTNTVTLDLDVLEQEVDLGWLYAVKNVDGVPVVQLERLYHEVTWAADTRFLEVRRTGPRGRFFPIKVPEDLDASRVALQEMLGASVA